MHPSSPMIAFSMAAAALTAVTSLAGILWPATYARETRAWAVQAIGQDWANLLVVVMVFGAAGRARSGSWRAAAVWLGCLGYLIYAFAIYSFALHFNRLFPAYVAVLGLSFWAFAGPLAEMDLARAVEPLRGRPRTQGAGALLIAIGVLFAALWLSEIVPHVIANTAPASLAETALWTNPVHVLDLAFVLPAMVTVGALARRQRPWGLLLLVPLLIFAVTMGIGILALFAISAMHGLPVMIPAVALVGIIVVLSATYAGFLLRPRFSRTVTP